MASKYPQFDNQQATFGETLGPAMEITEQDHADEYLAAYIRHMVEFHSKTGAEAKGIAAANLGYYAGYYDAETRARVERLFHCSHPVFGAIAEKGAPTTQEAFAAGVKAVSAKGR